MRQRCAVTLPCRSWLRGVSGPLQSFRFLRRHAKAHARTTRTAGSGCVSMLTRLVIATSCGGRTTLLTHAERPRTTCAGGLGTATTSSTTTMTFASPIRVLDLTPQKMFGASPALHAALQRAACLQRCLERRCCGNCDNGGTDVCAPVPHNDTTVGRIRTYDAANSSTLGSSLRCFPSRWLPRHSMLAAWAWQRPGRRQR